MRVVLSGLTDLSLNSIDVLTGIPTLKICVAYKYNGEVIDEVPANLNILAKCEPVYEELPGWTEDITGVRSLDELPENARKYVERVSELTGIQLSMFSVGPDRNQTNIVRNVIRSLIDMQNSISDLGKKYGREKQAEEVVTKLDKKSLAFEKK